MVFNDIKFALGTYYKPRNMRSLVRSILHFWQNKVLVVFCNSKIDHIFSVRDKIIAVHGEQSGF